MQQRSSLEAQLTNVADEIAYNNHDIQDGIKAKKISVEQLEEVPLFFDQMKNTLKKYPTLSGSKIIHETVRLIINLLVTDLINNSKKNIKDLNIKTVSDVRDSNNLIINFSDNVKNLNINLKKFLYKNLYKHPDVLEMTNQANHIIKNLFDAYIADIKLLPTDYYQYNLDKINKNDKERVICDYIAGMTDRFALQEHIKLYK